MDDRIRTCSFCGESIGRAPFARQEEEYCCEGCFLKQKEFNAMKAALDNAHMVLPEALVTALDEREHQTGMHSKRVACYTAILARHFTDEPEQLHQLYWGALLHDIGKIGVPDAILLKEGHLTTDEWAEMRTHPDKGYAILARIPFFAEAAKVVLGHEERFDGSGYPQGLAGEAIPWGARIFAVIDTLDAMTSDRPYRKGLSFDEAKEEIIRMSGTQFDPKVVKAFLNEEANLQEMVTLKCGKMYFDDEG